MAPAAERHPPDDVSPLPSGALTPSTPNLAARILRFCIRGYQLAISPWLPAACRYLPTCSAYAMEAVQLYGAWRGSGLAVRRICRCHPFHAGGFDPVPLPPHLVRANPSATAGDVDDPTGKVDPTENADDTKPLSPSARSPHA